jgi:type IV pilus assembly protein PilA
MAEVQWYYARNDQQFGPVSAAELKQLADGGNLSPDDLLWREGMDAWTTAINLRGLFGDDPSGKTVAAGQLTTVQTVSAQPTSTQPLAPASAPPSLHSVVRATQTILWITCVLIVLAGAVLFARAFLAAQSPSEEAAAGAVFSTFFIGAYVLARCGEKLSRLLLSMHRRRSR